MSVRGLSYVVLRCADLERSRQFYETLGLQLIPEQHGKGLKHYSCDLRGVTLELYPLADRSTSGLRLGLVVSDLDRVMASLRSKAIAVALRSSEGTASATVMDPDGHQIELEQDRPRSPMASRGADVDQIVACGNHLADARGLPRPPEDALRVEISEVLARKSLVECAHAGLITREEARDVMLDHLWTFICDAAGISRDWQGDEALDRRMEMALFGQP